MKYVYVFEPEEGAGGCQYFLSEESLMIYIKWFMDNYHADFSVSKRQINEKGN